MNPPIRIRDATPADWPFIREGWRGTFMQVGQVMQGADKQHSFEELSRLFACLMPTASAKVAYDAIDEDSSIGFVVHTGDVLQYAYVIKDLRRQGVATLLLDACNIKSYSFRTFMGDRWLEAKSPGWAYRPRFTFSSKDSINGET